MPLNYKNKKTNISIKPIFDSKKKEIKDYTAHVSQIFIKLTYIKVKNLNILTHIYCMKDEEIIEILSNQNFWYKDIEVGIERQHTQKIMEKFKTGEIIVVSGVRRSGKSFTLLQVAKKLTEKFGRRSVLLVNFEDYRWKDLNVDLLEKIWNIFIQRIFEGEKPYLLLDEIHLIEGWEKFVRTIYSKNIPIIVSGSSSKLLSKEYTSLLSGRYVETEVFPFSFKEFLVAKNVSFKDEIEMIAKKQEILRNLFKYFKIGGFPKVALTEDLDLVKSYFETIIVKDVVERFNIREIDALRRLATFYIVNFGNPITFRKVSNSLEIPFETTRRFTQYLKTACLLKVLNSYSTSYKKIERNPAKFYVIDTSFTQVYGIDVNENIGRIMENVVLIELLRKENFNPLFKLFYLKMEKGEIDFLIKYDTAIKQLIQVTYANKKDEIDRREIEALIKASELLKCENLLIITWDCEDEILIDNKRIVCKPLWKWLLE
jgi:uncharacterized protein